MVKRVINFVYKEIRGLHQAAYILALFAISSQILAVVRDRLLAHTFGAGTDLDLYYTAFRIPDLLFVLFASVLSIYVLLPFVTRYTESDGEQAGTRILSQVFTIFLIVYVVVAGLLAIFAPWYTPIIFPGFEDQSDTLISLLRILLIQPFLLGLSSLCGVVTQINHRFVLYAISPLFYNFGIILGITTLFPIFGLVGLAVGVIIGAFGHLAIQLPFVWQSQFSFSLVKSIDWSVMRKILAVSIPRAFTLSVNQIVLLVLVSMASVMTAGSVSVFQFAFNLQSVPLVIIGMSYSVAAFPTLSNLHAKKDAAGFNNQLVTALRHIIFWSLPIIGLVIVLRAQIVRVLLGSGAFDWGDTRLTAAMLAIFVVSLFAQSILLLLIRAFYAGGKTFLPLIVSFLSGSFSIGLAFILRSWYEQSSVLQVYLNNIFRLREVPGTEVLILALAFILGQFVQLLVLMVISMKSFNVSYKPLRILTLQALVAAVSGVLATYVTLAFVVDGVNQETFVGISLQGISAGVMGLLAIILAYLASGSTEIKEIYRSFHARIFKTDIIAPQE